MMLRVCVVETLSVSKRLDTIGRDDESTRVGFKDTLRSVYKRKKSKLILDHVKASILTVPVA